MKKKALLILTVPLILLSGTPALHGADIEGKVTLSPKRNTLLSRQHPPDVARG
jgi:hypothetical protein